MKHSQERPCYLIFENRFISDFFFQSEALKWSNAHSYFGIGSDREVTLHLFINESEFSDLIFAFIEMKIIWGQK